MKLDLLQSAQASSSGRSDRRTATRFPIERPISCKYARGRSWSEASPGKTLNISSTGILFFSDCPLVPGNRLQIAISWPVQLDGKCGLKLVASGNVVRSSGNVVAAKIEKYDFRVQSRNAALSSALAARRSEVHPARLAV